MAGDLDGAGRAPRGAAGREGVPAGPGFLRGPGVLLLIREGLLQDWRGDFIVFRYIIIDFRYARN